MIKLMDILKEVSTNVVSYKADGGEPDTGWTLAGKDRVLGVNMNKPEPWFEKGGWKQLKYPTADDPYKGDRNKNIQRLQVIKKVTNVGDKYEGFQDDVGSWDKFGIEDYSLEYEHD